LSVVTVENNATGQLARLIKRETGISARSSILKYDGRPFTIDELIERVEELKR
jgi:2-oxoglutarate ferredoxin oxidoreductase subunit alpha